MNRRHLLAGAGICLASPLTGCLEDTIADGGTPGETHSNKDEKLATIESASIRTFDSADELPGADADTDQEVATPSEFGLSISVNIVNDTATSQTPARVEIIINYEDEEPLTYEVDGNLPYVPNLASTEPLLHLYPKHYEIEREDDNCWRVDRILSTMITSQVTLEPEESVAQEFNIVADENASDCYPIGKYELIQQYRVLEEDTTIYWAIFIELS